MNTLSFQWKVCIPLWIKFIFQICALTKIPISAPLKIIVKCPTTGLRVCTIQRSTNRNTALNIQKTYKNASMVTTALLRTVLKNWKQDWFTKWRRMQIFICFTLKQSGVHSTKNTTRLNACTLTTGKTLEENLIFSSTRRTLFVKTGNLAPSLQSTMKAVLNRQVARTVMVGKSKNTTRCSTRPWSVKNSRILRARRSTAKEESSALISTAKKKNGSQST